MNEINFLTEKDIPYFERLEKEGKAIIIRIDPEKLINLDLSELRQRKTITVSDIREWVKENNAELVEAAEKAEKVISENKTMKAEIEKRLVYALSQKQLTDETAEMIIDAIDSSLSDEEIIALLQEEFTPAMIDRVLNIL